MRAGHPGSRGRLPHPLPLAPGRAPLRRAPLRPRPPRRRRHRRRGPHSTTATSSPPRCSEPSRRPLEESGVSPASGRVGPSPSPPAPEPGPPRRTPPGIPLIQTRPRAGGLSTGVSRRRLSPNRPRAGRGERLSHLPATGSQEDDALGSSRHPLRASEGIVGGAVRAQIRLLAGAGGRGCGPVSRLRHLGQWLRACAAAGEEEGLRPGIVSVVQTFGDRANFHPHDPTGRRSGLAGAPSGRNRAAFSPDGTGAS